MRVRHISIARRYTYQHLGLPTDGQEFLTRITAEFDKVAQAAERGLASNRFAAIRDGRAPNASVADVLPCYRTLAALETQLTAG